MLSFTMEHRFCEFRKRGRIKTASSAARFEQCRGEAVICLTDFYCVFYYSGVCAFSAASTNPLNNG